MGSFEVRRRGLLAGAALGAAWAAAGRADLFERVFRRRLKFSVIPQEEVA